MGESYGELSKANILFIRQKTGNYRKFFFLMCNVSVILYIFIITYSMHFCII